METEIIGGILTSAIVSLLLGYFQHSRTFRFDASSISREERKRLKACYQNFERGIIVLSLVAVVVSTYLCFKLLLMIESLILPSSEGVRYALHADPTFHILPSFFLGIFLANFLAETLLRLWLGATKFDEYKTFEGLHYGFNSKPVIQVMAAIIVPPIFFFSFMLVQNYYYFSDSRIVLSHFFSLKQTSYAYKDVKRIVDERSFKAPNGNKVKRQRFMIEFSDGWKWSSQNTAAWIPEKDIAGFLDFVSERSGQKIEIVDPYKEN